MPAALGRFRLATLAGFAALILGAAPRHASAQTLAQRVHDAGDGVVRMSFPARPGVCGSGGGISTRESGDGEWIAGCLAGPVRVALTVRAGEVLHISTHVAGQWRPAAAEDHDLGDVDPVEAARFLLELARDAGDAVGQDAVEAAALADRAVIWPELARLARDSSLALRTRKAATFWLGQRAADAIDTSQARPAPDEDVRASAVFALSQRPRSQAVPALTRVYRTTEDPYLRRRALFWLGQTDAPQAIDLFVEILQKSRP
jgi:HEAT repeats